ncbi:MAG: hypothetical protein KF884_07080 [Fimbriimonadaceae bacterium]|nr:hypothetical protein [Fimbriimonadaceae bacterium]QYK57312.1 MAG: hypothetical protein KF884_07080 [Fimbriimonadaceae bacterium]
MKRPAPWPWAWGWALAPVAMVGAWLSLNRSEPQLEKTSVPMVASDSGPSERIAMAESDRAPAVEATPAAAVQPVVAGLEGPKAERRPGSQSALARRTERSRSLGAQPPNKSLILAKWTSHDDSDWSAPVRFDSPAPIEREAGSSPEPVVVIVTESPDPSTGGHQAVEVSRQADVVFGG